jgi:VWFA-related protein
MRPLTAIAVACWLLIAQGLAGTEDSGLNQEKSTFHADVHLVLVDVQVINKKTHQIAGSLKQDDLRVYEDGVQQQIRTFSQDKLPLSIILLIDLTDSVRPVLQSLSQGALLALQHLRPQDQVAVLVYSASTYLVQGFTTDRSLAAAAIERAAHLKSREAAFFNEGIYQAATHLSVVQNPDSRRVILWFTDNVPNIPSDEVKEQEGKSLSGKELHTEKQALKQLFRTGTVVCTLLKRSLMSDEEDARIRSEGGADRIDRMMHPPGDVYKYANATGGLVVESNEKKLPAKLADLIDDLRLRYTLGYSPSVAKPQGSFCTIKVELAPAVKKLQKELVVEARQGYYR